MNLLNLFCEPDGLPKSSISVSNSDSDNRKSPLAPMSCFSVNFLNETAQKTEFLDGKRSKMYVSTVFPDCNVSRPKSLHLKITFMFQEYSFCHCQFEAVFGFPGFHLQTMGWVYMKWICIKIRISVLNKSVNILIYVFI